MEYKVISVVPIKQATESGTDLANRFESVIQKYASEGWEYVRLETLKAWVPPGKAGCFGSPPPGYFTENYVIVFKR